MNLLPLTQDITYWTITGVDGNNSPTWAAGVKIKSRWVRKDGIFTDSNGDSHKVEFSIYTAVLIPKRSMVVLEDQNGVAAPIAGAREVMTTIENPSLTSLIKHVM